MLRHRNRIKAILSSSSFKLALSLLLISAPVFASTPLVKGVTVRVPLETFGSKRGPALTGTLWLSKSNTDATHGTAVLLVHMLNHSKADWSSFGEDLSRAGFTVLAIDLRQKGGAGERVLLEDVQSGVMFLRTDKRVRAPKVALIGANVGANGAAHYASANRQIAFIVNSLILLSPSKDYKGVTLFDSLENIWGLRVLMLASRGDKPSAQAVLEGKPHCKSICTEKILEGQAHGTDIFKSKEATELKKTMIDFLLRKHA